VRETITKKPPLLYWADFVIFPLVAALCAWKLTLAGWLLFPLGFALFTFAEYWTHRELLHRWFYHGTHEQHHKEPEGYVTFAWWVLPLSFFMLWLALPLGLFAGLTAGYCWFIFWHHVLHHTDWAPRYAHWHLVHHRAARWNFGITTPLWDRLFGTYRSV